MTQLKKYDIGAPEKMTAMAEVLKKHVVKQKLYSNIKGKNYVQVEGWQFAGGLMGLFPRIREVQNLSSSQEVKWQAVVDIVSMDGKIMSTGFAVCSSKEASKKGFDEYAILSMAQTRAIGKAYRNLIGWVMKLAGYEGTPSEEMHKVDQQPKEEPSVQLGAKFVPPKDYSCVKKGCGNEISEAEANYSMKMYGKPLCRTHQKEAKKI